MAALQLKYGDLTLDVIEAWSESLDWPVDAHSVPSNWAGVALSRRAAPRRISIRGAVADNTGDITESHRLGLGQLIARINESVENSKRNTKALWQLWFFNDRYILCRPISFSFEHVESTIWASRFSAEFVAADPRWYAAGSSNAIMTVGGTSVWASLGTSLPGYAPTEPRLHYRAFGASQFALTNRFKNVINNAMLRERDSGSGGVPLHWSVSTENGGEVHTMHFYEIWGDTYGKAWLNHLGLLEGESFLYQDVMMTEPGSVWSLSALIGIEDMAYAKVQNYHLGLDFLSATKAHLADWQSTGTSASWTEQTLTILNKTAPPGTQWVRPMFVAQSTTGYGTSGYLRWMQLERAASNTPFEYKQPENITFTSTQFPARFDAWVDCREGRAAYLTRSGDGAQSALLAALTDGNFWSLDPGANELVLEAYGATSQSVDLEWENAWWAK